MKPLRFAILGTGFWARYQLAAWRELPGAECVALYNRTGAKAAALAAEFGVPAVYDDAKALLAAEELDFVDIITDPGTHREFVELAAAYRLPVICQKPMAPTLEDARAMADACTKAGVPLLIHENWRWQSPLRALKAVLESGAIGTPFRARLDFVTSFPVFENQPFLAQCERFILTDVGTHVLDAARFLFGESQRLFATTQRVNPAIRGEDVATVVTTHRDCTVVTNLSYASRTAHEKFPETFAFVEGPLGSVEITRGCQLHITTASGTETRGVSPPAYPWADPAYAVVHASIVDCHRNLLAALRGETSAETTAEDNLKTLELVFAAYESAASGMAINPSKPLPGRQNPPSREVYANYSPSGWYIASYIERIETVLDAENADPEREVQTVWENRVLIRAFDPDTAYRRTMEFLAERGWDYEAVGGVQMRVTIDGLTSLLPVFDELKDGEEIEWLDHGTLKLGEMKAMIRSKAQLESFRPDRENQDE